MNSYDIARELAEEFGLTTEIMTTGRWMHEITDDGVLALDRANNSPFIFLRGSEIVAVNDNNKKIITERLSRVRLKGILDRCADFVKVNKDGLTSPARPPADVVADIQSLPDLEIQRHNIDRFCESYGLVLGSRWYTEFVSGRQVKKRLEFQEFIQDAHLDEYDVLLANHTSRFGRNQAECIFYKAELQSLDKVLVFVSQGIISGNDQDFVSERLNERWTNNTAETFLVLFTKALTRSQVPD